MAGVSLAIHGHEFHIPLSLSLRLFFDFLARHPRLPQSASQIEACFRTDPFYREHAANATSQGTLRRRVSQSSVRVYVERLREALDISFRKANLRIESRSVLVSEETVTNEIGYRLLGTFQWLHTDHLGQDFQSIR